MGLYQVYSQVSQIRHATLQMEGPLKKNFLKMNAGSMKDQLRFVFP